MSSLWAWPSWREKSERFEAEQMQYDLERLKKEITAVKDRKLPETDRVCPKCGDVKAHGPEYRRGIKGDEDLGEHLRYYCCTCGYMTITPTQDHNTPERARELTEAFDARMNRPRSVALDEDFNRPPYSHRRPSQGWSK